MNKKELLKNLLLFTLLGLAVLGWGMFLYQDRRLEEIGRRTEASVVQQLEYRRQAEEALKQKVDSKKQAEQFMVQRDYERQLEQSMGTQFSEYTKELDRTVSQFDGSLKQYFADADTRLRGFSDEMGRFKDAMESYKKEFGAARDQVGQERQRFETSVGKKMDLMARELTAAIRKVDGVQGQLTALQKNVDSVQKVLDTKITLQEGGKNASRSQ